MELPLTSYSRFIQPS